MTNDTSTLDATPPEESGTEAPTVTTPVVTVTSGNPTEEEVAALTVLLAAVSGGGSTSEPNLRRGWARPARRFNRPTAPGLGWGRG